MYSETPGVIGRRLYWHSVFEFARKLLFKHTNLEDLPEILPSKNAFSTPNIRTFIGGMFFFVFSKL